jgi:coiled-coil domain-containing protein 130
MQGFNMGRYVPPDLEGTTSGNRLNQKRAPGALRKDGTQTVRFEMPFAVWCHTCKPHAIIGQGVRFNAEKKKIGTYYSTPIWQFKLKHVACGGFIEIKTDPKETAYVVVAGGKARDYGEDRVREGEDGRPILTPLEREKRREDAFAVLEGRAEEKEAVKDNAKRIEVLYRSRERDWEDPGNVNKKLRQSFRRERKILKREEDATKSLKERIGTDMNILPETELDAQRAKLVSFENRALEAPSSSRDSSPFFRSPARNSSARTPSSKVKAGSVQKNESKKDLLRRQLVSSTRAAMNPFG